MSPTGWLGLWMEIVDVEGGWGWGCAAGSWNEWVKSCCQCVGVVTCVCVCVWQCEFSRRDPVKVKSLPARFSWWNYKFTSHNQGRLRVMCVWAWECIKKRSGEPPTCYPPVPVPVFFFFSRTWQFSTLERLFCRLYSSGSCCCCWFLLPSLALFNVSFKNFTAARRSIVRLMGWVCWLSRVNIGGCWGIYLRHLVPSNPEWILSGISLMIEIIQRVLCVLAVVPGLCTA